MQSLFWLVQMRGYRTAVTRRLLRLAIEAYKSSGDRTRVHDCIHDWVKKTTAWKPDSKVSVFQKIVELIKENKFEPPESYKKDAGVDTGDEMHDDWAFTDEPEPMSDEERLSGGIGRERSGSSPTKSVNKWWEGSTPWRMA
jgi:hypothetical protein